MIQRIQTVWLLLAAAVAILTLKLSFFSGNIIAANQTKSFQYLTAASNLIILLLTVIEGLAAFIAIFLYKNRKLQLRISLLGLVISLLNIVLYYYQTRKFAEGNYDLTAIVTLLIPIFFVLAARDINKDQHLVKSLDRLR
ncbi:MAG: DUF4293 domain-containing protein [Chitinophagaceae bacterium]